MMTLDAVHEMLYSLWPFFPNLHRWLFWVAFFLSAGFAFVRAVSENLRVGSAKNGR